MDTGNVQIFNQKRPFTGGPVFRLHDDYMDYSGRYEDFKIRYEDLPPPSAYRLSREEPWWLFGVPIYCLLVGLALLSHDHNPHMGAEGFRWFVKVLAIFLPVMAVVCGVPYLLTRREYTILPSAKGQLIVGDGRDHDVIIAALNSRRLSALRRHAVFNPLNPPDEEVARFQWLRDEGAISEEEFIAHKQMILGKVKY